MPVLNTASPKASPRAPNERPRNAVPSSRTSSASGPLVIAGTTGLPSPRRLPVGHDQGPPIHRVDHPPGQGVAEELGVPRPHPDRAGGPHDVSGDPGRGRREAGAVTG